MNLPNSILGQPLSAIGLVFGRVPYIQNALPITVMIGVSFWVLPMRSDGFSVRQKLWPWCWSGAWRRGSGHRCYVRRRSGARRCSRPWRRRWRHRCYVRRRRWALPRPMRSTRCRRRSGGRSWRRARRSAGAQPCYGHSIVRTRCVSSDVADHYHQRCSRGNLNLEGLIRIRAEACVSNPVGADVARIEAPQISGGEDEAGGHALCVGIDRDTLRRAACARERVRIVMVQ